MKKTFMAILLCLPLMANAQNEWEEMEHETTPQQETKAKKVVVTEDQKYLAGAVPVVDGHVVFTTTIKAPGKSAAQIYGIIKGYMEKMTKMKNQSEQSRIAIDDPQKGNICGVYQEWLVFKSTALVLDRTRFFYNLIADVKDGEAVITMNRIYYLYDEERNPQTMKAEEWITDEYGLKKNKEKLSRVSGKFRKKTIDRKDYIFKKLTELLNDR